jgi:hypothetical protein
MKTNTPAFKMTALGLAARIIGSIPMPHSADEGCEACDAAIEPPHDHPESQAPQPQRVVLEMLTSATSEHGSIQDVLQRYPGAKLVLPGDFKL